VRFHEPRRGWPGCLEHALPAWTAAAASLAVRVRPGEVLPRASRHGGEPTVGQRRRADLAPSVRKGPLRVRRRALSANFFTLNPWGARFAQPRLQL